MTKVSPPGPGSSAPRGRPRRHRVCLLLVLSLLAGFLLLQTLPSAPGAIRVGGIGILWWYGGLVVPLVAWGLALLAAPPRRAGGGRDAEPPDAS
jgi:hypothetical protein